MPKAFITYSSSWGSDWFCTPQRPTIVLDRVILETLVDAEDDCHEREASSVCHGNAVQHALGMNGGNLSTQNSHAAHESSEEPQLELCCPWLGKLVHGLQSPSLSRLAMEAALMHWI